MTEREKEILRSVKAVLDAKDQTMLRAKGALELAKRHLREDTAQSVSTIIDDALRAIATL